MKILAFDTSNRCLSVAIVENNNILGQTTINTKLQHSAVLMPVIDQLLKMTGIKIEQIDRFVVAQGPGSYTGIRIAVTTAKSLAWTLNKELVGVSSLAVLAANISSRQNLPIIPLFNARRNNVFASIYRWENNKLVNIMADTHISIDDLIAQVATMNTPVIFVGDDVKLFVEQLQNKLGTQALFADQKFNLPNASVLADLGAQMSPVANIYQFVPTYLRRTEAENNWLQAHPDAPRSASYVKEV
ncbi:MAG: tRNA (adenosine(37)-N6)-threonylcarbamoyltransferase complex dimerization subunit type 1 TsaB [Candidatus Paralactobacillus gallistercoris]|uniref:tRNA (Adenosine(37)-N6)-threonylcarbamoyltransferase complex dimerization subunit type 1 TsaB n=1 Tax=Candidatus Paralactobacillus gallistercoris TaxID=2838724 RepID=A0A948WZQ1_9LACO|nr:tRNA (adenosine(37)-N6)-threonylcarbamoyltransferase complex dimerization subunit type 1 TsaB [Candidatus Paralactobacillus gallistercoris]